MPDPVTIKRARRDAREGKPPSTQAGEFVREEIEQIREGRHGVRNARQAIAIGLSQARRAGVKLPAPAKGKTSAATRKKAQKDLQHGAQRKRPSRKRSRATEAALRRESGSGASHRALSRQAHQAAKKRGAPARRKAARNAAQTRRRRQSAKSR